MVRALGSPRILVETLVVDALQRWMRHGKRRWSIRDVVLTCPKCKHTGKPKLSVSGQHYRADCPKCGRYIKFVSPKPPREIPE